MAKEVRTRFAPSPTGYLHVGGLRTALYGWLFSRKHGGKFILRIEDTDQQRFVDGAVDLIYRSMAETGLTYDEGPDIGGNYGPYIQSERREIYKEYADKLVEAGGAYYCFCDKDTLDAKRKIAEDKGEAYRYDRTCMNIPLEEARKRIAAGESYVVRQRIPDEGEAYFDDLIFGHISVDVAELEDGILLKSDGLPTYNFANVVDDHLMEISHIIRGTEYLSSTPKYNLIYRAFGWDVPEYLHLPPVMKNEKQKLSKRHGDASFEDFLQKGYLKEAIVNYIALLGWSPGTNQEIFTMEELYKAFDVSGISRSPAIFDVQKLTWMNEEYIRNMDVDAFIERARPYFAEAIDPDQFDMHVLCAALRPRISTLCDIPEKIAFLAKMPDYDIELFRHKKMKTDPVMAADCLNACKAVLETVEDWRIDPIHDALSALAQERGQKPGQLFYCLRIGITGTAVTPGGAMEAAYLIGKEETLRRLDESLSKLA
ncbi:MAG: glutamate--tRNA ligase [Clostridiales bacterium]|nr:glutamate--tRNA ligase [Clostridiales bacterium]